MGCGASMPDMQARDAAFAAASQAEAEAASQAGTESIDAPFRRVMDANGDYAYVKVHDNGWGDMVAFNAARRKAEEAEVAAAAGALRSAMRHPSYDDLTQLRTERRVLRLGMQPVEPTEGSNGDATCVRVRISADSADSMSGS
jgi:predicted negative regulator of RcsB-dependent stress response